MNTDHDIIEIIMLTIWEGFILGFLQGIAEWIPISSEAVVNLVALNVFKIDPNISLQLALLLHVGTVIAAVVYFRKDLKGLFDQSDPVSKVRLRFLTIATTVSLVIGGLIYLILQSLHLSASMLTIVMGIALLITAWLLSRQSSGERSWDQVSWQDGTILGLTQGLAVLPGISRSGSTMAVGLWRKFALDQSILISFIMGIPMIIVGAGLLLVTENDSMQVIFSIPGLVALITSAIVGYVTIDWLLKIARQISFVKFVTVFGIGAILVGVLSL